MVLKLLNAGVQVNAFSYSKDRKRRCTALHYAAGGAHIQVVKVLVKHGADETIEGEGIVKKILQGFLYHNNLLISLRVKKPL